MIFLDCRNLDDYELIPFAFDNAVVVIASTNAPHALVDGKYLTHFIFQFINSIMIEFVFDTIFKFVILFV